MIRQINDTSPNASSATPDQAYLNSLLRIDSGDFTEDDLTRLLLLMRQYGYLDHHLTAARNSTPAREFYARTLFDRIMWDKAEEDLGVYTGYGPTLF